MTKIFSYLFTTAAPVNVDLEGLEDFGRENPLAGLGYGKSATSKIIALT